MGFLSGSVVKSPPTNAGIKPGLCNNQDEWDGKGGGREVLEGGDIFMPVADSR